MEYLLKWSTHSYSYKQDFDNLKDALISFNNMFRNSAKIQYMAVYENDTLLIEFHNNTLITHKPFIKL